MKIMLLIVTALSLTFVSGCATSSDQAATSGKATCNGGTAHSWSAWNNVMPGSEKAAHVIGKVSVNTGGWKAELVKRSPQGFNPQILMLDLKVTPPNGPAAQVLTELPVHYIEMGATFKQAQIFCEGKEIANLPVKDAQ